MILGSIGRGVRSGVGKKRVEKVVLWYELLLWEFGFDFIRKYGYRLGFFLEFFYLRIVGRWFFLGMLI